MSKILITMLCFLLLASGFGCGPGTPANANKAGNSNTNVAVNVDPNNMPPGLSTSPVLPSANTTPGIPANITALPKGATPTPGIPSPAELKKGIKPGVTPTPGIPDPATMRRQMNTVQNANAPPPANGNTPMMMRDHKKPKNKP